MHPNSRGNNVTPKNKIIAIQHYALNEGLSVREIMEKAGVAKNTVEKYRPRDAMCKCGRSILHRGQCKPRLERMSPEGRAGLLAALDRGRRKPRAKKT